MTSLTSCYQILDKHTIVDIFCSKNSFSQNKSTIAYGQFDFFIIRIISLVGFEAFLTSMVAKEVETLPRGIYHSSLRRQGAAANQGKAIGSIPSSLLSQYQKTRQPGLRPGLAGKISQSRFKTWYGR